MNGQYGCGPIEFSGSDNAMYERHILFDNVVDRWMRASASVLRPSPGPCGIFSSQRWVLTEGTYARQNPKRV